MAIRNIYILLTLITYGIIIIGYNMGVNLITLWPGDFPFQDINLISASLESLTKGFNPYLQNPFNPSQGLLNYPKLWLILFDLLGLKTDHTIKVGLCLIIVYVLICFLIFKPKNLLQLILLFFLVVISPNILLLLERANCDIIIFTLTYISIYFLNLFSKTAQKKYLTISLLITLFASFLKIYPIMLIFLLINEDLKLPIRLRLIIISLAIFIIYFIVERENMYYVLINSSYPIEIAYGKNVFWGHILKGKFLSIISNLTIGLLSVISIMFYLFNKNSSRILLISKDNGMSQKLFLTGSLIYLLTFFIGNNFDIRLIFLIFTLPLIFDNISQRPVSIILIIIYFINSYGTTLSNIIAPEPAHLPRFSSNLIHLVEEIIEEFSSWILFSLLLINVFNLLFRELIKNKKLLSVIST